MSPTSAVNNRSASAAARRDQAPDHSPVVVRTTAAGPSADSGALEGQVPTAETTVPANAAALLRALATPAALISRDTELVLCNPPLLSLTDWGEFIGTPISERIVTEDRQRFIDTFARALTRTHDDTRPALQVRVRLVGEHPRHVIIHLGGWTVEGLICQVEAIDELVTTRGIVAELTSDRDPAGPITTVLHALARPPTNIHAAVVRSDRHCDELVAAPCSAVGELARQLFTSLPWTAATATPAAFAAGALPPDAAQRMRSVGYETYVQVHAYNDSAPGHAGHSYRLVAFSAASPARCAAAIERVGVAADLVALVLHRVAQSRKLTHAATHDALTKVANRHGLEIEAATRLESIGGVIYVDLDRLKPINDQFGHHVGDAVLRAVAGRLQRATRPADLVARIGGDEFVVVLQHSPDPRRSDADIAERIADRIVNDLSAPIEAVGRLVQVSASVGVAVKDPALGPDHPLSVNELIGCADTAMYDAKRAGGSTLRAVMCRGRAVCDRPRLPDGDHLRTVNPR